MINFEELKWFDTINIKGYELQVIYTGPYTGPMKNIVSEEARIFKFFYRHSIEEKLVFTFFQECISVDCLVIRFGVKTNLAFLMHEKSDFINIANMIYEELQVESKLIFDKIYFAK